MLCYFKKLNNDSVSVVLYSWINLNKLSLYLNPGFLIFSIVLFFFLFNSFTFPNWWQADTDPTHWYIMHSSYHYGCTGVRVVFINQFLMISKHFFLNVLWVGLYYITFTTKLSIGIVRVVSILLTVFLIIIWTEHPKSQKRY